MQLEDDIDFALEEDQFSYIFHNDLESLFNV